MCGDSCAVKRQVLAPTPSSAADAYEPASRVLDLSALRRGRFIVVAVDGIQRLLAKSESSRAAVKAVCWLKSRMFFAYYQLICKANQLPKGSSGLINC